MIRVSELTKRYGAHVAVDRISFEVARGEIVGFLGPNGAGKTTTIRVLTGYHPATSGRAEVAGHDVAAESLAVRKQLGYLPQEVPIYPELRVAEYLRYRAALKGVPGKQRKLAVERAMAKAGIDADVARQLVGHVSHGYRQRLGLADALVANPPILILDEPTSGMDPNQRRRIKQVVRDLAAEHTVLFSSHILGEVQEVSSRVIVIHRGTLRADGKLEQLIGDAQQRVLRLTVGGSPAAVEPALAGAPGVEIASSEALADGSACVTCRVVGSADPRAEIGARLLRAGLPVHELRLDQPTLEEYFYAITEGRDREEETAVAAALAAGGTP
jgi:ABC-2 type transport system ATP-binding protein